MSIRSSSIRTVVSYAVTLFIVSAAIVSMHVADAALKVAGEARKAVDDTSTVKVTVTITGTGDKAQAVAEKVISRIRDLDSEAAGSMFASVK